MSVLSDILQEEYNRLNATINAFESKKDELPKGYIVFKQINDKKYPYLQWRSGNKIKSKYIKKKDLDNISKNINLRKKYESDLKKMYNSKKEFDRIIGREI